MAGTAEVAAAGRAVAVHVFARRFEDRVEKIELMLDAGESGAAICRELKVQPLTLARQLYRRGRHDLASRLELWRWNSARPARLRGMPAQDHVERIEDRWR